MRNRGPDKPPEIAPWRQKVWHIIFNHNTPGSRAFDIVLMFVIVTSVIVVMLESVPTNSEQTRRVLWYMEWGFTILFTIEYILRCIATRRPWRYMTSFFGIVDLLSFLPTYIEPFVEGAHYLLVIRILRLLRIFRILKLLPYIGQSRILMLALRSSRPKIIVFLAGVLVLVVILGALMYIVENPTNDTFSSIPASVYWAIVTLTTVGYGDIVPQTIVGQVLSALVMLLGYAIIAVPTGIVIWEMTAAQNTTPVPSGRSCPDCGVDGHEDEAIYCRMCGGKLIDPDGGRT